MTSNHQPNSFTSSCLAFAVPLWMRYRRDYLYMALGTIVAIVAAQVLAHVPAGTFGYAGHQAKVVEFGISMIAIIFFIGCFTFASKLGISVDRDSPTSAPKFSSIATYSLPVTTTNLVLAPMATAIASVVSFWVMFWVVAALPFNNQVPLLLPILVLSLMIASSKASGWTIYNKGGIGCLLMLMSMGAPMLVGFGMYNHVPMVILDTATGLMLVLSIKWALDLAPSARQSIVRAPQKTRLEKVARQEAKALSKGLPDLRSPLIAQIWFHRHGKTTEVTMVFLACVAAILLIRIPFSDAHVDLASVTAGRSIISLGSSAVFQFSFLLPICLLICAVFSTALTMSSGLPANNSKEVSPLNQFIAIRPISSASIVISQLAAAFRTAMGASYVVWVASIFWLFSPIEINGKLTSIRELLFALFSLQRVLLIILTAGLLPVVIFSVQSGSMVSSRLPQKVMKVWRSMMPLFVGAGVFSLLEVSFYKHISEFILPVGLALLCVKAVLVQLADVKLERKRLISRTEFLKGAGLWFLTVALISAAFYAVLPTGFLPFPEVFILIALVIPANRILWHIYYLDASRHVGGERS